MLDERSVELKTKSSTDVDFHRLCTEQAWRWHPLAVLEPDLD